MAAERLRVLAQRTPRIELARCEYLDLNAQQHSQNMVCGSVMLHAASMYVL